MAVQVTNAPGLPNTVSGTGTTAKTFGPQLNMPGSLRLDGQQSVIRIAGNISAGVSSTAVLTLYANYPTLSNGSPQYPFANITNAVGNTSGGANIALYNANNNFVIGQYVNVTNVSSSLNGLVGPLIVANSTAFAGQVAGANVGNAAAITLTNTAGATGQYPQPLYTGVASPALNVSGVVPFMAEIRLCGDQQSGVLTAYGTDQVVNINTGNNGPNILQAVVSTGLVNPVAGVNFKNEPPVYLTVAETFGSSNASNTATLKCFFLES